MIFASTKGEQSIYDCSFSKGSCLLFGNETAGLPAEFYQRYRDQLAVIPMPGPHARSLNLAESAAVLAYEAYRQILNFK